MEKNKLKILVIHKFVSDKPLPYWLKDKGIEARDLCEKYKFDIFVCGDNHKFFIYEHPQTKQLVFNCGCVTRQKLDEKDYKPRIYLFDTETKKYEVIYLLDNNLDVITNVTNDKQKLERSERIDNLIELVDSKEGITFDFKHDLRVKCEKEKVKKEVEDKINEILEE